MLYRLDAGVCADGMCARHVASGIKGEGKAFISETMLWTAVVLADIALWSCEGTIFLLWSCERVILKAGLGCSCCILLCGPAGRVLWCGFDGCLQGDMIGCFVVCCNRVTCCWYLTFKNSKSVRCVI